MSCSPVSLPVDGVFVRKDHCKMGMPAAAQDVIEQGPMFQGPRRLARAKEMIDEEMIDHSAVLPGQSTRPPKFYASLLTYCLSRGEEAKIYDDSGVPEGVGRRVCAILVKHRLGLP